MNDTDRKKRLEESLNKAMGLDRIFKTSEFQIYLLPYLKELSYVSPIDPSKFTSDSEFHYALRTANARAHVFSELIRFLSSQEGMISKIREEILKPKKQYGIE